MPEDLVVLSPVRQRSATGRRRLVGACLLGLLFPLAVVWWWVRAPAGPSPTPLDAPATSLAGVRLGASRDDVVFHKGLPSRTNDRAMETPDGAVVMLDARGTVEAVVVDCSRSPGHVLMAVGCGDPVERLESLLGPPGTIERSADSTRRTLAYGARNAAFLAAHGKVSALILYAAERRDVPARSSSAP